MGALGQFCYALQVVKGRWRYVKAHVAREQEVGAAPCEPFFGGPPPFFGLVHLGPMPALLGQAEYAGLRLILGLYDRVDGCLAALDLGLVDPDEPQVQPAEELELLLAGALRLVARRSRGLLDEVLAQQVVAEPVRVPLVGRGDEISDRLLGVVPQLLLVTRAHEVARPSLEERRLARALSLSGGSATRTLCPLPAPPIRSSSASSR